MLLERRFEPVGPDAAHRDAPHPGQLLEPRRALRPRSTREEIAARCGRAAPARSRRAWCSRASPCTVTSCTGKSGERSSSCSAGEREREHRSGRPGSRRACSAGAGYPTWRHLQNPHAQVLVGNADCARRHRHQAVAGHAGRGVDLEQPGLGLACRASGRRVPSRGSRARGTPRSASACSCSSFARRQAARADGTACRR